MSQTQSFCVADEIIRGLYLYESRKAKTKPTLEVFVDLLWLSAEKILEVMNSNWRFDPYLKRCFLAMAFEFGRMSSEEFDREFKTYLDRMYEAIQEEIDHDSSQVTTMITIAEVIKKHKELIFFLSRNIDQSIKTAVEQMVGLGFVSFKNKNPEAIFRNLIPPNPEALIR